jgi:hypothetical protein
MIEYKNRYGDVFTFELNERGNIDWKCKEGNFGFHRFGSEPDDFDTIIMIDPSGGPYLVKGYDMGEFSEEFLGMKVKRFVFKDGYYEIVIKKED